MGDKDTHVVLTQRMGVGILFPVIAHHRAIRKIVEFTGIAWEVLSSHDVNSGK